jgi:predicted nuclease of restriction endonuclease-like (RecB) superfamily
MSGQFSHSSGNSPSPFALSWSHYVFLLRLAVEERGFYEIEAIQRGWTLRELKRQFNTGLYGCLALSRDQLVFLIKRKAGLR